MATSTNLAACGHCRHWKHRFDTATGHGRGTCWHEVPAVLTREDDGCDAFTDRLANRADVERLRTRTTP